MAHSTAQHTDKHRQQGTCTGLAAAPRQAERRPNDSDSDAVKACVWEGGGHLRHHPARSSRSCPSRWRHPTPLRGQVSTVEAGHDIVPACSNHPRPKVRRSTQGWGSTHGIYRPPTCALGCTAAAWSGSGAWSGTPPPCAATPRSQPRTTPPPLRTAAPRCRRPAAPPAAPLDPQSGGSALWSSGGRAWI